MAVVYNRMGGKGMKVEEFVAHHVDVQEEVEARAFEVAARAEVLLMEHRQDGHASIDIEHGDIDWYVVLNDERGQDAALSIEYGRAGYIDQWGNNWGEMEGLYILARASNLPKKRKRLKRKRRDRPEWMSRMFRKGD